MKLRQIWRSISNKPELVICGPIRLDYSLEYNDEPDKNSRKNVAKVYPYKGETGYEDSMGALLRSLFGRDALTQDRPVTIIDVVEDRQLVGSYGGWGAAVHLRFDTEIRLPIDGTRVARKIFDVSPPERIGSRTDGEVSGGFPRQEIEAWLKAFSYRVTD